MNVAILRYFAERPRFCICSLFASKIKLLNKITIIMCFLPEIMVNSFLVSFPAPATQSSLNMQLNLLKLIKNMYLFCFIVFNFYSTVFLFLFL